MKSITLKLIGLVSLFMILTLSLFAESLTDEKGLFRSNSLIKKVLADDKKVKIHKVEIEGLNNISIEVLSDLENDINLEERLSKEIKLDKIILGETTFDEVKKYYGFGFKMYDYIYEGKSYKSKDMCLYDKDKNLYLHFSSSDIPSSFTFIDWVTISSKFDETIIPESECHIKTVSIYSKNYLDFSKQQIAKLFGKATDKGFRYKEKNEYYEYSIEKAIEGISMGRQRELYPSKSISFDFNKDGKVFKYTIGTPMEYGEFLESQNGKYQCLSEGEKERVENRLNKFYGDTVNFIQCKKNKTPLEEYVCKDEELLVMFKVLTQGQIYAFENATKEEVNHKTYTKENGLYKDGFDDSDWSIKKYRQNGKVNKKQLCYDLKIQTIETSGLQVYTNTDIARMKYTPKFTNYQTQTTHTNPSKPLIQKDFGRLYRTLLKKALKEKKPKFAGKYIIAQWGCDEGKNACTTGGVIDASTGKATEFPFKYYEHNGSKEIIYKLNSSLIIFSGDFKFKGGRTEENKVLFYEFKDGEFLFLKASEYKK